MKYISCLLAILAGSLLTEGYKILAVFPMPSKSHVILAEGLVKHLLDAGHEVTLLTPIPRNNTPANLRQIDVSENFKLAIKDKHLNLKAIIASDTKVCGPTGRDELFAIHNQTFHIPQVQRILLDPQENFDIVIAEWMFSELYAAFSTIFDVPLIWLSTLEPHWIILSKIDQNTNPAYTSDILSSKIPPFNFYDRFEQLMTQVTEYIVAVFYIFPLEREIFTSIIPYIKQRGNKVPDFEELRYTASLVLGNSYVSMGSAMPLPQSYKPVGGYHIDINVKPLPKDLQELMDNAKHGVIYFSMGTMLKSDSWPEQLKQNLVKMFSTLKQTVIWKIEEDIEGLPDNLYITKWAPQHSILAHPNCRLFITHGGLLSAIETIHFGKPIIGIPGFTDQCLNIDRAVKMGFAIKVDLSNNIVEDLKEAIVEALENKSYSKKVKELSFIHHHRPITPGKEIVHWVEHVIQTDGALHLRSPALHVPFYQKFYLDLAAVILLVLILLNKIIKGIFKQIRSKKLGKDKKKY